ncbi:hypothetical protein [Bacillus altitudinis]|uniref:hypothetical protein n=1 Tax=Bacillus altitudinis TaxID=293387 RepID=UPI00064C842A|nr:hypothetical protein [Bacillus altitudinis]KLV14963.1 hypothetical protein ABW03_19290 [Bacillus altitudinis]
MRIKSIKTLFKKGSYMRIANVFASLPDEEVIANAIRGEMAEFLRYAENSKEERENPNQSWNIYDYADVTYKTSVNEEGKEYLSEVTFITPTSDRVITLSKISISIDFGDHGSSYAAGEVLCSLNLDEFTKIEWMDGSVTSALDYKTTAFEKLLLKKDNEIISVYSEMPQVDLLESPCELLVDKMFGFGNLFNDLICFIEDRYRNGYSIFVDQKISELIINEVSDVVRENLCVTEPHFFDVDTIYVYKGQDEINSVTYIRD